MSFVRAVNGFHPRRGEMFIAPGARRRPAPFGGAEWFWSDEALLEFRSSERSWYWNIAPTYKHLTPNGVKTAVEYEPFAPPHALVQLAQMLLVAAWRALRNLRKVIFSVDLSGSDCGSSGANSLDGRRGVLLLR